jgi:hypothetical protein
VHIGGNYGCRECSYSSRCDAELQRDFFTRFTKRIILNTVPNLGNIKIAGQTCEPVLCQKKAAPATPKAKLAPANAKPAARTTLFSGNRALPIQE